MLKTKNADKKHHTKWCIWCAWKKKDISPWSSEYRCEARKFSTRALSLSQISINVNSVKQTRLFQLRFYDGWTEAFLFVSISVRILFFAIFVRSFLYSAFILHNGVHYAFEQTVFLTFNKTTQSLWTCYTVFTVPFHKILTYTLEIRVRCAT